MHQRGRRDLPAFAGFAHLQFRFDLGIGHEHLVERGVAVHLAQRLHVDALLAHVEQEVRQALVLRLVPIGTREQQRPVGLVRTRGPDLLAVDDPLVALEVGARGGGRHVRA